MGAAAGWLKRHPVAGFLAFSHGWTFGWWSVAALLAAAEGGTIWAGPAVAAFYVGGAGVFLGGVVMTAAVFGRGGLLDLWHRIVDPRRIKAPWWAVLLLLYPALTVFAAGLAALLGMDPRIATPGAIAARAADLPAFLIFLGFVLLIGPLPEEIGWRGYLLDRLRVQRTALAATALLALAWWSWHLPLPWLPGYYDAFEREPDGPFWSLVALLPAALLHSWVYLNAGRSVLAVILFHWLGNLSGQVLLPSDDVRLVRLVLEYGVALGVVAVWGRDLVRTPLP